MKIDEFAILDEAEELNSFCSRIELCVYSDNVLLHAYSFWNRILYHILGYRETLSLKKKLRGLSQTSHQVVLWNR